MVTKQENPQKDSWWISELDSLGVSVRVRNELNDIQETSNLAENLKHVFIKPIKMHIIMTIIKNRPIFKWR